MSRSSPKLEKNILKRYTPLGVRIKTLGLSKHPLKKFLSITKLESEEIKEIQSVWKERYSYSIYIYGFSIVVLSVICFDYFRSLSIERFLLLMGFIAMILFSGVSIFLNSENVEELDRALLRRVKITKNSIKYFLVKFFILSDKPTRKIHTDYVVGPNMFLPIGVLLCFTLLSNLGVLKEGTHTVLWNTLDQLLISFDIGNGWYIGNYISYFLLSLFTLMTIGLDHERELIDSNKYLTFVVRSSIVNVVLLFLYFFAIFYIVRSETYSSFFEVIKDYWLLFMLGIQNFLVVLLHSLMTIRDLNKRSTNILYCLLILLISPFLIVFVLGLQLVPAIIIIPIMIAIVQLYKFTKTILKVPSFVRVLGFSIAALIFFYKFYNVE